MKALSQLLRQSKRASFNIQPVPALSCLPKYRFTKTTKTILESDDEENDHDAEVEQARIQNAQRSVNTADFQGVRGHRITSEKADLANSRIGDKLELPYEVTASDFQREIWQSVFYQQDRIHTSLDYCSKLKASYFGARQDTGIPLPFSQILYAATSMSHVDDTRNVLELAFRNCTYERCVFNGDTLKRSFEILNIRESSNGNNILVDLLCKMYNQLDELVFRCEKTMYFENMKNFEIRLSSKKGITPTIDYRSHSSTFKKFLLKQGAVSTSHSSGNTSIKKILKGELILHTMQRPVGLETNMNLSMLHRMTHPLLYNTQRYDRESINVSGCLLIALTHSIASKELYEVVYEELLDSHLINRASPHDCIGALTYVMNIDDNKYEYYQEVECITIGVKNIDLTNELDTVKIPLALLQPGIYPRDVEKIVDKFCPILKNKIVVHSYRKLLRHKPTGQQMLIPLL